MIRQSHHKVLRDRKGDRLKEDRLRDRKNNRFRDRFDIVFIPGAFPELVEGRTQKVIRITPILLLLYLPLLEVILLNAHLNQNHR